MVDRSPSEISKEAAEAIGELGFFGFIRDRLLGGIYYTIALTIMGFILAVSAGLQAFIGAFRDGIVGMLDATFGGVFDIMGAGAATAVQSFTQGMAAYLGPLAWPASVAVGLAGVWVAFWFYARIDFSPLQFVQSRVPWR